MRKRINCLSLGWLVSSLRYTHHCGSMCHLRACTRCGTASGWRRCLAARRDDLLCRACRGGSLRRQLHRVDRGRRRHRMGHFKRPFAFLDRFGQRKRPVVLNITGGGNLKTAMSLGKILRDRKLDVSVGPTIVAKCAHAAEADCFALKRSGQTLDARIDTSSVECDLACVVVLAGGVHRTLPADARVNYRFGPDQQPARPQYLPGRQTGPAYLLRRSDRALSGADGRQSADRRHHGPQRQSQARHAADEQRLAALGIVTGLAL